MTFFIAAGIYLAIILTSSYITSRNESRDEFLIGERRVGAVPLAISLSTSWLGGGALVFMMFLVINDLPGYFFLALGAVTQLIVFSIFVKAPYEQAKQHNWISMTEMVSGMIGKRSGAFVMVFVLILFCGWLLFELIGSGLILSGITPLTYVQSIVLMATVIFVYLYFGGFKSLIRTDLIQYSLMGFMLLACFYLAKDAPTIDLSDYVHDKPSSSLNGFLAGFFGFFAAQFSESTIWQRVLAAKSAKHAQRALLYTGGFYVFTYGVLIALIILGLSLAPDLQDESLFAFIAFKALPTWLGPLFLVAILAIIMSTIDTLLFIAAQCFSTDMANLLGKKLTYPMRAMRVAIFGVTVAVVGIALLTQDIAGVFWFIIALWASLAPVTYLLLPKSKPSDQSIFTTMVLLALSIIALKLSHHFEDHFIAYIFCIGLVLPLGLDKLVFYRRPQSTISNKT